MKKEGAQLLAEIVELLSSDDGNLTNALLKTKVVLRQLGSREPAEWVDRELNGYDDASELPPYRVIPAVVKGNLANPAYRYSGHPIPTGHLTKEQRQRLEQVKLGQSLAALEQMAMRSKDALTSPIPMEFNHYLGKSLAGGYQVQHAWCEISAHDIKAVLVQVRSRLLDFLLELQERTGDARTQSELKSRAAEVDTQGLFNKAIFGSHTTIIVGNHNTQNVHTAIQQGDLEELVKVLLSIGLAQTDIDQFQEALKADKASQGEVTWTGKVGGWVASLMGKAATRAVDVGVDTVAQKVVPAVASYLGLPAI